ncbi:MAG: tandem-95 repeat protein [Pseudomonadota bacterium]
MSLEVTDISFAGNQGGGSRSFVLSEPGEYLIQWDYTHFTIQDETLARLGNTVIFDSGLVGGSGGDQVVFTLEEGETETFSVLVNAPLPGTAWNISGSITYDDKESTPVAEDDEAGELSEASDAPLIVPISQLLANDSDKDDDIVPSSFTIVTGPQFFTGDPSSLIVGGNVVYTPSDFDAFEANGGDEFTYTITDQTGNVSEEATVFIDAKCVGVPPYVVLGGTIDDSQPAKCIVNGTFTIGRRDGTDALIEVVGGSAEIDATKISVKRGQVFSVVGDERTLLFTGAFDLPAGGGAPSNITLPSPGALELGGLSFEVGTIQLDPNTIKVGGGFVLPDELGGDRINLGLSSGGLGVTGSVNALRIDATGVGIDGGRFQLANTTFSAFNAFVVTPENFGATFTQNDSALFPDITVDGKLTVSTPLFDTEEDPQLIIDLAPPRGVKISDGVLEGSLLGVIGPTPTFGGFKAENLSADLTLADNQITAFTLGGAFKFPKGTLFSAIDAISARVNFLVPDGPTSITPNGFSVTIDGEVPIPNNLAAPLFLTRLGFTLENIFPDFSGPGGASQLPFKLGGALGLGLGKSATAQPDGVFFTEPTDIRAFTANLAANLRIDRGSSATLGTKAGDTSFEINGQVIFGAEQILSLSVDSLLNLSQLSFNASNIKFRALFDAFTGTGSLKAALGDGSATVTANGNFAVPNTSKFGPYAGFKFDQVAFFEGASKGDDFALQAGVLNVPFGFGNKDIGIRYDSANGLDTFASTKPALAVGSWEVAGTEDYLEMHALWENVAGRDVDVIVTYQETVGGPILQTFTLDEFAANGIEAPLELSSSFGRAVFVTNPIAGVWDIQVVDETGLGAVTYDAFIPASKPEVTLDAITLDPNSSPGAPTYVIDYTAIDPDSDATLNFFFDTDNTGFDGQLIEDAAFLTESHGAGTVTFSTAGLDAGSYFVYAQIFDDDNAPVFSAYSEELAGPSEADLELVAFGPAGAIEAGASASYDFEITNVGPDFSSGMVLEIELADFTAEPSVVVRQALDGVTPIGFAQRETATTDGNGDVVLTADGDFFYSFALDPLAPGETRRVALEVEVPDDGRETLLVDALVTSDSFDPFTSDNEASLQTPIESPVPNDADLSIERRPLGDQTGVGTGEIFYELVVTNNSLLDATGATVVEDLGPPPNILSNLPNPEVIDPGSVAATSYTGSPWQNVTFENYSTTVELTEPLRAGASIAIPMRWRPELETEFEFTATVSHDGDDPDRSNDSTSQLYDVEVRRFSRTEEPNVTVDIETSNFAPLIGEEITVTVFMRTSGGATANPVIDVQIPDGLEITNFRFYNTINGDDELDNSPESDQLDFDPLTGRWQLDAVTDETTSADGRALELTLNVLDDTPLTITAELVELVETVTRFEVGNGVVGEQDDATLVLNDPAGPPDPPEPNSIPLIRRLSFADLPDLVEGEFFSFQLPEDFATDNDGTIVSLEMFSAPAWASFDEATRTISGTPETEQDGGFFQFQATDDRGATNSERFLILIENTPDAPEVTDPVADQFLSAGLPFNLQFLNPTNESLGVTNPVRSVGVFGVFTDSDFSSSSFFTTLPDGSQLTGREVLTLDFSGLPSWLNLDASDPENQFLYGLPGLGDVGATDVTVTATDRTGLSASDTFTITVDAPDPAIEGLIVSAIDRSQAEGTAAASTFRFDVYRLGDLSEPASVDWAVGPTGANPVNLADFAGRLPSGSIAFAAGEERKLIEIDVVGDFAEEADETFEIILSNAVGTEILVPSASATILNDDDGTAPAGDATLPEVGFIDSFISLFEGEFGPEFQTVELLRQGDLSGRTEVTWELRHFDTEPSDFGGITPSGTVVFEPGENVATFELAAFGDSLSETPSFSDLFFDGEFYTDDFGEVQIGEFDILDDFETFDLILTGATGGTINPFADDLFGDIFNDDPIFSIDDVQASLTLIDAPDGTVLEGGTATFQIETDFTPFFDANFEFVVEGFGENPAENADVLGGFFTDIAVVPGFDNFAFITVDIADDLEIEGDEQLTVYLNAFGSDTTVAVGGAVVTIIDNDFGALDDAATITRNQTIEIPVLDNDLGQPGDPFTITAVSDPAAGSASITPAGAISYTPDVNVVGVDTFTYTVANGAGDTDTATVAVSVLAGNPDPNAVDDSAATAVDTAVEVDVLANDSDLDLRELSVSFVGAAENGEADLTPDGTILYTPDLGFEGIDQLTYQVTTGTSVATATLSVSVGNAAPILVIDQLETEVEDRSADGSDRLIAELLLDDDGIGTHVFSVTGADAGFFRVVGDQLFLRGDAVLDAATDAELIVGLEVDDTDLAGAPEDTGSLTLNLIPFVNSAPVAFLDIVRSDDLDPIEIDVLDNDFDIDGDVLSLVSVGFATGGTFEIVNDKLMFTRTDATEIFETIAYEVTDGTDTVEGTLDLRLSEATVSVPPADIQGDDTAEELDGTPVGEVIAGAGGGDTIRAEGGDDTVRGDAGDDLVFAGTGNDSVSGGADVDAITGEQGSDTLSGGPGNDLIVGGPGEDLIYGGPDDDVIAPGPEPDQVFGGPGVDTVAYLDSTSPLTVDLGDSSQNTGDAAGDDLNEIENVVGAAGAINTLIGNADDNTLTGGALADSLDGGAGNDSLIGGPGADSMAGGPGDDTFAIDDAGDVLVELPGGGYDRALVFTSVTLADNIEAATLRGTDDLDVTAGSTGTWITGNSGDNELTGGASSDRLDGRAGNDTLDGAGANDILEGGSGADVFVLSVDTGIDTILDFELGVDLIDISALGARFTDMFIEDRGGDAVVAHASGTAILKGVASVDLSASNFIEATGAGPVRVVTGTAGNDVLSLTAGPVELQGLGGNDVLRVFNGEATLTGGTGDDIYQVYESGTVITELAGEGYDRVYSAVDLTLAGHIEFAAARSGAAIDLTGNAMANQIFGNGESNTLSGLDGNDRLGGEGGTDLLIGGLGNDVMFGGTEADVFAFSLGDGADVIRDFELGVDTIDLSATGLGFSDLMINDGPQGASVRYGLDSITLPGITAAQLTEDQFEFTV